MATASNETAMAADDAQPAAEARHSGAPAWPPSATRVRAKQGRIVENIPSALVTLLPTIGYCYKATKISRCDARKLTRR